MKFSNYFFLVMLLGSEKKIKFKRHMELSDGKGRITFLQQKHLSEAIFLKLYIG